MNSDQITLVQSSFAQVAPIADTAATLFYDRLFEIDPPLRRLFNNDLKEQRMKLVAMLATAVNGLNQWATVSSQIQRLGQRHIAYGVKSKDYDTVGQALIGALEAGLGDAFTSPVRDAWIACYTAIAKEMMQGAEKTEAVRV